MHYVMHEVWQFSGTIKSPNWMNVSCTSHCMLRKLADGLSAVWRRRRRRRRRWWWCNASLVGVSMTSCTSWVSKFQQYSDCPFVSEVLPAVGLSHLLMAEPDLCPITPSGTLATDYFSPPSSVLCRCFHFSSCTWNLLFTLLCSISLPAVLGSW